MEKAQQQQADSTNKHRRADAYEVGDYAMLDTNYLRSRHKLQVRYIGPLRVAAVRSPLVVELELPTIMRISRVVNVNRLKRFHRTANDRFPGREQIDRPPPEDIDGNPEFEVEYIMGKRRMKEGGSLVTRYLVKWVGYDVSEASWERESSLANSQELDREYDSQAQQSLSEE